MNLIKKNLHKFFGGIRQEFAELDVSVKKLRQFGFLIGGILMFLALISFWRTGLGSLFAMTSLAIAVLLIILAWGSPVSLRTLYRAWMLLALVMGLVVGTVLLFVLFYLVITPIRLLQRVFGDDPLTRSFSSEAKTYWKPHQKRGSEHLRRPF